MNLGERLWVCAIPESGVVSSPAVPVAVGGGLVAELVLAGRLVIDAESVTSPDPTPLGDDLLDPILAGAADPRSRDTRASWFVANVGKTLTPKVADRVVEAGAVERAAGKRRRLWLDGPERLRPTGEGERIRSDARAVLLGERAPDERDVVLVGLVAAAELVGVLVEPDQREIAMTRAETLASGDGVPAHVRDAIDGARRAVASVIAGV